MIKRLGGTICMTICERKGHPALRIQHKKMVNNILPNTGYGIVLIPLQVKKLASVARVVYESLKDRKIVKFDLGSYIYFCKFQ